MPEIYKNSGRKTHSFHAYRKIIFFSLKKGEGKGDSTGEKETWSTDQGVITVEKNKAELLIRSAVELMEEENED